MSMAEQVKQYKKYVEDPINNPRPEALADDDYLMRNINRVQAPNEPYTPPVPIRTKPKEIITPCDYVNGKKMERYCFSQDQNEVTVRIPLPEDIRKSSDVHVSLTTKYIEVWFKKEGKEKAILNDYLREDIDKEESHWTLVPGEALNITLVKAEPTPRLWEALLEGDDEPINIYATDFYKGMEMMTPEKVAAEEARMKEMNLN